MLESNLVKLNEIACYFKNKADCVNYLPLAMFGDDKFPYSRSNVKKLIPYANNSITLKYLVSEGKALINDCTAGETGCFLGADGTIFTCVPTFREINTSDRFVMGNLKSYNYDFDKLWNSEQADLARANVKSCSGCAKKCGVSREKKYRDFDYSINANEVNNFKSYISSNISLLSLHDEIGINQGLFPLEGNGHIWIEKNSKNFLKVPKQINRIYSLEFILKNGYPLTSEEHPIETQILLDGKEISSYQFNVCGVEKIFQSNIKSSLFTETIHCLEIKNDLEWVPDEYYHNGDLRKISLMLTEIKLSD